MGHDHQGSALPCELPQSYSSKNARQAVKDTELDGRGGFGSREAELDVIGTEVILKAVKFDETTLG